MLKTYYLESSPIETIKIASDNASFEIKISDFHEARKTISNRFNFMHTYTNSEFVFQVDVSPGKDTEDWIELNTLITDHEGKMYYPDYISLHCAVSIIDIEGNSRCPVTLELPISKDFPIQETGRLSGRYLMSSLLNMMEKLNSVTKYLKKSFVLNRAEDLLPDGVLTLRVDFQFDLEKFAALSSKFSITEKRENILLCSTLDREIINEDQTPHQNDVTTEDVSGILDVFDFTGRILTLPQFHDTRRRFGVYGIPPKSPSFSSDSTDIVEDIWMFDIEAARFLLSLDEQDSAGSRLLKASPVIRRMVSTPMREKREKRIEFLNVRSHTFFLVLYFLISGNLIGFEFDDLLKIYEFFHQYEMEDQQQICAECLSKNFEHKSQFDELERIAYHYNDKYLSKLLKLSEVECEDLEQKQFRSDEISYSDCYV